MIFIISVIATGIILWNTDRLPLGIYLAGLFLCFLGMSGGFK